MKVVILNAQNSTLNFEVEGAWYGGPITNDDFTDAFKADIQSELDDMNNQGIAVRQYESSFGGDFKHDTSTNGEVIPSTEFSSNLWDAIETHGTNYQSVIDNRG